MPKRRLFGYLYDYVGAGELHDGVEKDHESMALQAGNAGENNWRLGTVCMIMT